MKTTKEILQIESLYKRFLKKINKTNSCWLWTGRLYKEGYGEFGWNNGHGRAHRFSYTYYKGKIPNGLVIDHLCRVRSCVNPDHLEAVTIRENRRTLSAIQ